MEKNPIILPELPAIDGLTLHTSKEGEVGDISLSSLEGIPGSEEIRAAFARLVETSNEYDASEPEP